MNKKQFILLTAVTLALSGCGGAKYKTLGSLKYEPEEEKAIEFKKLGHEEVREEYKELLDLFEDEKLKEQIERRIADVYMLEGEHDQAQDTARSSYYIDAIKAYKNILEKYPNSPDNAEVLYQLSKAYDIEGRQEDAMEMLIALTSRHPNFARIPEAYFRQGDIYFSWQKYREAEIAYNAVVSSADEKYLLNAQYMLGWTQYKRARFRGAFSSFSYVLNELLGDAENLDHLNTTERPVAEDAIHSMSLALDKIGGAQSITSFEGLDNRPYIWLVYNHLGEFYLEKELYEQSAETYRTYLSANSTSKRAPQFHNQLIAAYTKGKFPRQALVEKETFIEQYGIYSSYYKDIGIDEDARSALKVYLDELARHNYSQGTDATKQIAKLNKAEKVNPREIRKAKQQEKDSYILAANFYDQFVDTFPEDERVDEVVFLKSEALFLAKQYVDAIPGYEKVAYEPQGTSAEQNAADAGYAAIISYQRHIESLEGQVDQQKQWQSNAVDSMLRFAGKFHLDERSPTVLTNSAEYLFSLNRYERALEVASNLIDSNKSLAPELKKTAYGIMAHSQFKLEDYAAAQTSYINQRSLTKRDSEEYGAISERLASATFKNAETMIAADDKDAAITELLKIKTLVPDSPVRVVAQHDAVGLLLEQSRWSEAIVELRQLSSLYPEHELSPEFARRIAFAYRNNEEWRNAAKAYLVLYETDKDVDIKRESLFTSAEMFEEARDYNNAIENYKTYAHIYEQPFDIRMEARYKLTTIYEKIGEKKKRNYWLGQIITGNREAGRNSTERSQWLAAWAHIQFADQYAKEYKTVRLSLPLVKSLGNKKAALEKASESYQKASDFGHLEFVSEAGYKLSGLYSDLANSLRRSPTPNGLSSDDRATYTRIIGEQAQPLDDLASELLLANIERAWDGSYNDWIEKSYEEIARLQPLRFGKEEKIVSYGDEIR